MDNGDPCSSLNFQIATNSESDSSLNKIRINDISPLKLLDSQFSALKSCSSNKEDISFKKSLKENKPLLVSDSDDSFEIFMPKKSCNIKTASSNNSKILKNKQKKKFIKSRTCPYFPAKSVKNYFQPHSKSQEDKDLELALARSLLDVSGSNEKPLKKFDIEKPLTKDNIPILKTWSGKETKKRSKSLLEQRTAEDRQRIITQKIAIILLDKKIDSDISFPKKDINLTSSILEGFLDQNSSLWELSKLSVESFITDFYVQSLRKYIEPPSSSVFYAHLIEADNDEQKNEPLKISSSKTETLKNNFQSPKEKMEQNFSPSNRSSCEPSPPLMLSSDTETPPNSLKNHSHSSLTSQKKDLSPSAPLEENSFITSSPNNSPQSNHSVFSSQKMKNPQNNSKEELQSFQILSNDFSSLFKNTIFSDVKIKLSNDLIPGHKIIFHARCPSLLNTHNCSISINMIDLSYCNQRTALALIKYIYSGKFETIDCLTIDEKKELIVLCDKFELTYLKDLVVKKLDLDSFYNQSTCSPNHNSEINILSSEEPSFGSLKKCSNENILYSNQVIDTCILDDSSSDSLSKKSLHKNDLSGPEIQRPFCVFSNQISSAFDQTLNSNYLIQHSTNRKRKLSFNSPNENQTKLVSESENILSPSKTNPSTLADVICIDSDSGGAVENSMVMLSKTGSPNKRCFENSDQSSANSSDIQIVNDSEQFELYKNEKLKESDLERENEIFRSFSFECNHSVKTKTDITLSSDHKVEEVVYIRSQSPSLSQNSQLETKSSESERIISVSQPGSPLSPLPNLTSSIISISQGKRDTSLEACLQTSFPNISLIEGNRGKSLHACVSTPISSPSMSTPCKKIAVISEDSSLIIKDATPRAEYSLMVTPELKEELRKYGLKENLEPKKARELLRYIYDQIHPGLPEQMVPSNPSTSKEVCGVSPLSSNSTSDREIHSDEEKQESNEYILEEKFFNESKGDELTSSTDPSKLRNIIVNFVKNDTGLYSSVLIFEPIILNNFYKTLKDHGVQCKISELMDTLDELCIMYRIERAKKGNKRKRRLKK